MTIEIAASKLHVLPEKIQDWEEGNALPTIKQAETLAKAYRRPFALFFLPDVPKDFYPLQDFRKKNAISLGTASTFIIREIQQKQAWISDIFKESDEQKLSFVGKFSLKDDPNNVATDILKTLQIDPLNYSGDSPIKEWIDKAESVGIFISRTSFIHSKLKLDSDEIQGFAIADSYAPFVFINSDDWNAPQLFTLVHELAHIWIAKSGISSDINPDIRDETDLDPVELFCNEVAASALLPRDIMNQLNSENFDRSVNLFKVAKKMGVSSFALLVRALNLNLISLAKYRQLKREADLEFKAFLQKEENIKLKQKEKPGGPNPYLIKLNKNSRLFTQIVLDAFKGGYVEATMASTLLNTQVNKFSNFESFLYK